MVYCMKYVIKKDGKNYNKYIKYTYIHTYLYMSWKYVVNFLEMKGVSAGGWDRTKFTDGEEYKKHT